MQVLWFAVFFLALLGMVIGIHSPRKIPVAGALMLALLLGLPPARSQLQGGILGSIQAVLGVIQGLIQTSLIAINNVRSAQNNFEQGVIWPQPLINQARGQVALLVAQYRNLMANLLNTSLHSATLPVSQSLEAMIRDHQATNFSALGSAFRNTYGFIPMAVAANSTDRALTDMDDAMTLDSLKLLKASDQAADVEIQAADSMENAAAQAAPGSAPLLTASAIVARLNSQALTQRMLAAELRQEAAYLAHQNTLLKENANNTNLLRALLVNVLQHQ